MPSIPQSLLWISLVVLWLFVLVPMLVNKRDAVRRTSDVALATRVLTSGSSTRLIKRGGPAAGHAHDPDWQPAVDDTEDLDEADEPLRVTSVTVAAAVTVTEVTELVEPDYLDVDVVDEGAAALPGAAAAAAADEPVSAEPVSDEPAEQAVPDAAAEAEAEAEDVVADEGGYDYTDEDDAEADYQAEGVADETGYAEADEADEADDSAVESEPAAEAAPVGSAERRRRNDLKAAAAVEARKYAFRKRVLTAMATLLVLSALAAFTVAPSAWWVCGSATVVTVLYLGYLRRQTRIEQQIRARRARRVQRSRPVADAERAEPVRVAPRRPIHPGTVPVDIDDEDPAFADLQYTSYAGDYGWRGDLPRAAGQ